MFLITSTQNGWIKNFHKNIDLYTNKLFFGTQKLNFFAEKARQIVVI
jgi:hypothetical protein